MKKQTMDQLREGDVVGDYFAVAECERKTTGANKPFLSLVLADATGQMPGVAWDNVDRLAGILVPDTIVRLEGRVDQYRGALQMKVMDVRPLKPSDKVDLGDFMPKTPHDIDLLYRSLIEAKNSVGNEMLRALLDKFFDDARFAERFRKHPAAKRMHHAYVGGLLEHTLCVAQAALMLVRQYAFLNRDLLVTGALLHDVGKTEEMSSGVTTDYTVHGQLVGHLTIGSEMVGRAVATIKNFPTPLLWEVQHLILSHHGKLEFGSPVVPLTMEALALNTLDMLDANLFQARTAIEDAKREDGEFTRRALGLDRVIYKRTSPADGSAAAPVALPTRRELELLQTGPAQDSLL